MTGTCSWSMCARLHSVSPIFKRRCLQTGMNTCVIQLTVKSYFLLRTAILQWLIPGTNRDYSLTCASQWMGEIEKYKKLSIILQDYNLVNVHFTSANEMIDHILSGYTCIVVWVVVESLWRDFMDPFFVTDSTQNANVSHLQLMKQACIICSLKQKAARSCTFN